MFLGLAPQGFTLSPASQAENSEIAVDRGSETEYFVLPSKKGKLLGEISVATGKHRES
jgi:hypothetical protein